jgi:hypothetical protein
MHGDNRHRRSREVARQCCVESIERVFANEPGAGTVRRRALAHRHWVFGKSLQAAGKADEARAVFAQAIREWPFKLDAWRQYLFG